MSNDRDRNRGQFVADMIIVALATILALAIISSIQKKPNSGSFLKRVKTFFSPGILGKCESVSSPESLVNMTVVEPQNFAANSVARK